MLGLIVWCERNWARINHQITIHKCEVVVIQIKTSTSDNSSNTKFIKIGVNILSRAARNIHRQDTLQGDGVDGLAIGQNRVTTIGETVIENGEGGLAGVRGEVENIAVEFILLGGGNRHVAWINNELSIDVSEIVV